MELIEHPNMTATEVIEAEKRMLSKRSQHILLATQFDALVNRLSTLRPPLTASATSKEVRSLADHLLEIAAAVDYYISRVGHELAYNAPCAIESGLFVDQLRGALEGNATFEINRVADILAEDER